MNRLLLSALCSLLLIACSSNKDAEMKSQLLRLNAAYDSAILAGDTARLGKILAADYQGITAEGQVLNREQQLNQLKSSGMLFQYAKSDEVNVRLLNKDVAILTALFTGRGVFRGNPVELKERYSTVWTRKDTTWQVVQEQDTRLAQ